MFGRNVCTTAICRAREASYAIYAANFFGSLALFLPIYIYSSYLAQFVQEDFIGLLYVGNSILVLAGVFLVPRIFSLFRTYRIVAIAIVLIMLVLAGLATVSHPTVAVLLFLVTGILGWIILLGFDVLLENATVQESETGTSRGIFLTMANVAVIVTALSISAVLTDGDYWKIYSLAIFALVPLLSIVLLRFPRIPERKPNIVTAKDIMRVFLKKPELRRITLVYLSLQTFYSWMTIYMPLYLNAHLGFSWQTIGVMFAIGLLPFLLFELPLGRLADKYIGEKELLIGGIIVTGAMTAVFGLIGTVSVFAWTAVLFVSRIGASMLEIASETHFFKLVKGDDGGVISVFRAIRATGVIIGPLIGSIALIFFPLKFAFVIFGVVMFFALIPAINIVDTR